MMFACCTNMNPNVTFDPKADAEAYCKIGEKDSEVANKFWDKVESAYIEKEMMTELQEFETIIMEKSQMAVQEYPVRLAKRSVTLEGEVSYYPDQDAETYTKLTDTDPAKALEFYNKVKEAYNADGLYEDLQVFTELCGTPAE